jgi:hypothetical protein
MQFSHMGNGYANKKEIAAVKRMQHAFLWAAARNDLNTGALS